MVLDTPLSLHLLFNRLGVSPYWNKNCGNYWQLAKEGKGKEWKEGKGKEGKGKGREGKGREVFLES